jgi:hypothetical protein
MRTKAAITTIIMIILCCIALSACGGDSGGGSDSGGDDGAKKGSYKIPEFKDAVYDAKKAEGNGEVKIDLSHTSDGYFAVHEDGSSKIKIQVIKDDNEYLYDIRPGKDEIFPLQSGDGAYTIRAMKNAGGTKYFELYSTNTNVKLSDKFQPYLRPNQYAGYKKKSKCVKTARKIAKSSSDEEDFVKQIYEYIGGQYKYDKDKANNMEKGYIPDPDKMLSDKKGICFDYACLAASMLRSQGIPTKIIFGYVEPDNLYHAWNMFYTEKDGWSSVEFNVNPKDWNRIDLTFYANGEDEEFIGDGSNYTEVYQY